MAAAWLDEREPATLFLPAASPAAVDRPDAHRTSSSPRPAARSRSSRRLSGTPRAAEVREGRLLHVVRGRIVRERRFRPDRRYREDGYLPPVRAPQRGRVLPRAARGAHLSPPPSTASRRVRPRPPPRAGARGRGTGTPSTLRAERRAGGRPATRREARVARRASAQSAIFGSRPRPARAPLLARSPARGAPRPGAPRTRLHGGRSRATRTCARRARRRAASAGGRGEIARSRRSAELLPEPPELLEELVSREEAARKEARSPLRGVPGPEVLDDRLRVDARLRVLRELAHRRRASEPLGRGAQLLEDLVVRVAPAQAGTKRGELSLVDAQRGTLACARSGHLASSLERSEKSASTSRADALSSHSVPSSRMGSGSVSRRSRRGPSGACRARQGAAAARRCPESSSGSSILAPSTPSRPGSPPGVALVSATNGKTTTTAMAARILGETPARVEPGRREPALRARLCARLRSERRARPVRSRRGRAARGDPRTRPRVVSLVEPVSRPARPVRGARARRRALAFRRRRTSPVRRRSSSTPTTRRGGARRRARARSPLRARRPASCPTALQHAATRSTASAAAHRTSTPLRTSATSATTAARPAGTSDRRSTSRRARSSSRADGSRFRLDTPHGSAASSCRCPGSTTSTTPSPPPRSRSRSTWSLRDDRDTGSRLQRGLRPVRADPGRGEDDRHAPDQEPGRRERGAPHARDRGAAGPRHRPERRDRRRSGRLVDLGRGLRAASPPRRAGRRERRAGRRARACVSCTAGSRRPARGRPLAGARTRPWPPLVDAGTDLVVLPTYTAMLSLRGVLTSVATCGRTGMARREDRVGHLYPEYLNIYADRGNIAVLGAGCATWSRARRAADRAAGPLQGAVTISSTSEAARIASRR